MNEPLITPKQMIVLLLMWAALALGGMSQSYYGQQKIIDGLHAKLEIERASLRSVRTDCVEQILSLKDEIKRLDEYVDMQRGISEAFIKFENEAVVRGHAHFTEFDGDPGDCKVRTFHWNDE